MKKVDKLPENVKSEIIELYQNSKMSVKDICSSYGFGTSVLADLIREKGIDFRKPGQVGVRRSKKSSKRVCRNCGSTRSPIQSRFCCDCGSPLYTEKESIINQLHDLTKYFVVINTPDRDRYINEINNIISKVKKLDVLEEE